MIRQAKGDGKAHTVQDSIPFQNMFPDGLCRLEGGTFSKTIAFEDVPRQRYQVILPLTSIKDNEVYAPNYKDGETVALIRYPHGGTFAFAPNPNKSSPPAT